MHPTALIVEDDPATVEILPQVVQLHLPILTVETAHSYDGMCDRLERQPYSVVLTDVRRPRMEGFAVLEKVLAVQPRTPVILMSTSVDVLASRAFAAGAFDVLPKPFRRESLIAILCQALQAHRISRDIEALDQRVLRLQERVATMQLEIASLQRRAARLLTPAVLEAVILHSRALSATHQSKRLIEEVERRKRALRQALKALRATARHAALIRLGIAG
jgi:DNA-binding NtrC family response regulator